MKKGFFCLIIISICLLAPLFNFAQTQVSGPGTDQSSQENAIAAYYKFIGANNHLYNGSEYVTGVYRETMHPYFKAIWFSNGEVFYDGVLYHDVPLMYDIITDQVITNRFQMSFRIVLVSNKIEYFTLLGHTFVRITQDSVSKSVIGTGFFDRLYDGKVKVYAKRFKKREELLRNNELIERIDEHNLFYVMKGGIYYSVQNKKSLWEVFQDHKSEIRKYLRKNGIKFRENPELAIMKSAAYYDQIKS
jgi:hypothetical protein